MKQFYYDLNLQVAEVDGRYIYSVVQESDMQGEEYEVLVSGSADTAEEALRVAVEKLTEHVKNL
jgi:hypothetical protein